jgi:hypothetical protein
MFHEEYEPYVLYEPYYLDWIDETAFYYGKHIPYVDTQLRFPVAEETLFKKRWEHYWKYVSADPNSIQLLKNNQSMIDWINLSGNPNAIHLLENNQSMIDWYRLSGNPNAIHLLEKNPDKVDWEMLCQNPNRKAIALIRSMYNNLRIWQPLYWKFHYCLNSHALSDNPNAISFLQEHPELILWRTLSRNPSAMPLLEKHPEKISWYSLSRNPSAISYLQKYPEKIDWYAMVLNPSVDAIKIWELNKDKIDWCILSRNPNANAISFLIENFEKINWYYLAANPNPIALELISILLIDARVHRTGK